MIVKGITKSDIRGVNRSPNPTNSLIQELQVKQ